jgi:superfamily II DNA or RNA helicase
MSTQANLLDPVDTTYEASSFPPARPFQDAAHERLREGARAGHRCQLVMAPTGSGKSYLGMRIIHEALRRGKRAIFLADRKNLVDQASAVADSYGLSAHGVIMSDHWRYNPDLPFQIASIQTLARRQWPAADVIVADEAHTTFKAATDHFRNTAARVVGLSATPFATGLGKLYTNLVCAATMHDLTESGVLVPMRVMSCTQVDMRGAATIGGEWSDAAAGERGMDIVGDVVGEWLRFAEGKKTIVFGSTIAHCEELCKRFNEAHVMASVFCATTSDTERKQILDEYRKPDSMIRVLISVSALAKGFDCIAEGSEVLTHRGLVAIEKVLHNDKLWDGHEFVSHGGIIYKGERDVITYSGLTATEDHLVKTSTGWVSFGECARLGIPIVCTASGQRHIREDEGRFTNGNNKENHERCISESELPMRAVRISDTTAGEVVADRSRVQEMLHAKRRSIMDSCKGKKHEGALRRLIAQGVQRLRSAWNTVQVRVSATLCGLDHVEYAAAGQGQEYPIGSERQQRSLRAGKPSLGHQESKLRKYAARWLGGKNSQIQDRSSRNSLLGQNTEEFDIHGDEFGRDSQPIPKTFGQTKRRVWDVLNAGPRNSFTCEGFLVHNCTDVECVCDVRPLRKSLSEAIQMWGRGLRSSPGKSECLLLDFSGNIIRFREDFEDVYFNGLGSLNDGEKLDKTVRKDDEKEESKGCPVCGSKPFVRRCMSCGFEIAKPSAIEALPGEMREVMIGKKKAANNHEHLWKMACTYARAYSKPEKQRGRASHIFRDIVGDWPPRSFAFDSTANVEISSAVLGKIRSKQIAFAKAKT